MARFLIAICPPKAGTRVIKDVDEPIDQRIQEPYFKRVGAGIKIMLDEFKIEKIHLATDARKKKKAFEREIEEELKIGGKYHHMKPFAAKIVEQALRIALVLSLFDNSIRIEKEKEYSWSISKDYMDSGIAIARWYLQEVRNLYDQEIEEGEEVKKREVFKTLKALSEKKTEGVSVRDICQHISKSTMERRSKVLQPILESLLQEGKVEKITNTHTCKWKPSEKRK